MSRDPKRLDDLSRLAAALRDRDLARLAAAGRSVAALDRHLAALDQPTAAAPDPATALAQHRHAVWAEARRRLLLPERDRLEAERLAAAETARQSFGRAAVLRKIRDQLS